MTRSIRAVAGCSAVALAGLAGVGLTSAAPGKVATATGAARSGLSGATAAWAASEAALAGLRPLVGPGERASSPRRGVGATSSVAYYNWSGYAADNSTGNTYTKVIGTWREPKVTCTSEDRFSVFWVGLDGLITTTVEQVGTYAWCFHGTPFYFSWWEMYPTNAVTAVAPVHPGDKITALVSFTNGQFTLQISDATTVTGSFSETQVCGAGQTCSRASAEWIAERPGGQVGLFPLAPFRSWVLTGAKATAGPTSGGITKFPNDAITMIDGTLSYALASVSALNPIGSKFSDTWANSF
jgi:hypothetical protein